MERKTLMSIFFVCVFLFMPLAGSQPVEVRPLVAYPARTIPTIDGVVSEGEWNDTITYEYIRINSELSDAPIKLQCALKHDDNWLYILFTINVVGSDCEISILPFPESDDSLRAEQALLVFTNGTVKKAENARTAIMPDWASSPDAEACTTFLDDEYLVEMKFNKTLFNITFNYSPFNIEYTNTFYGSHTVAIGGFRLTEPGLIFSSYYYEGYINEDNSDMIFYLISFTIVLITVPTSLLYIILRKRKASGKRPESKLEYPEGEKEG